MNQSYFGVRDSLAGTQSCNTSVEKIQGVPSRPHRRNQSITIQQLKLLNRDKS